MEVAIMSKTVPSFQGSKKPRRRIRVQQTAKKDVGWATPGGMPPAYARGYEISEG